MNHGAPASTGAVWLGAAAALPALALYLRTMAQTITSGHGGADGPELAAVAYVLGVAHPTGYPLYSLLGHAFTWLPWGEVAFRVGLLSVVSGTLGVGLVGALCRILGPADRGAAVGALAGGVACATAPLYWSQATIVEVYPLHIVLTLVGLLLLARWEPGKDRILVGFALVAGLGLAHHATFALLAFVAAVYVIIRDPRLMRRRALLAVLGAACVGPSLYGYLAVRGAADPPLNWGEIRDLDALVAHVTARAYRGYLLSRPAEAVLARIPAMARLVGEQLTWPGLVVALLGLTQLAGMVPPFARMLFAFLGLTAGFALVYNAAGSEVYLLPAVPVLAVGLGLGVAGLARDVGLRFAVPFIVCVVGWQVMSFWSEMDLSADQQAAVFARETLERATPGGFVLTGRDEDTFALWYMQFVEARRQDVAVIDRRLIYAPWFREQLERRYPDPLRASGL